MSRNQNKKPAKTELPEKLSQVKEVDLFFADDKFYNGDLVYKKGQHVVKTEKGWAARWINRGAKLVIDGKQYSATVSEDVLKVDGMAQAVEAPVEPPAPPPQDPPPAPPQDPSPDAGQGSEAGDSQTENLL